MPKNSKHCVISEERTGFNFKDLHSWIDQDEDGLRMNHRCKRHFYNTELEKEIKERWDKKGKEIGKRNLGKKAVVEWLFHIAVDNLETAMKRGKKVYGKVHNYFKFGWRDNGFIEFIGDRLDDDELEEEFYE